MVSRKINGKEYQFNEISYGDRLAIQDDCTVIDPLTEIERIRGGQATTELIKKIVTLDGVPVDISNKNQINYKDGELLNAQVKLFLSVTQAKNVSEDAKKDSQSLPTGNSSTPK